MFKRVMVAVVGIPLLLVVLGWVPPVGTMLLTAGMCAIGAWELMHAVRGERGAPLSNPLVFLPIVMAVIIPYKIQDIHIQNIQKHELYLNYL